MLAELIVSAADYLRIEADKALGSSRTRPAVQARAAAFYVLRERDDVEYTVIGRLADRDHSTIIHACRQVRAWKERDPLYARWIDAQMALPKRTREPAHLESPFAGVERIVKNKRKDTRKAAPKRIRKPIELPASLAALRPVPKVAVEWEQASTDCGLTFQMDVIDGLTPGDKQRIRRQARGCLALREAILRERAL